MNRVDYAELYQTPKEFLPPSDVNLSEDSRYPNLNTRDYRKRRLDRTVKHNRFFDVLTGNEENLTILVTNDLCGRLWTGNFWGYRSLKNFSEQSACFKQHCATPITRLKFLNDTKFVLGQMNGSINIWSTQGLSKTSNCTPSLVAEKKEHLGGIVSMDVLLPDKTKIATGSNDCFLKIWDAGESDLTCISSLRYAHSDDIVCISASPLLRNIFASCSRDRSALIWDYRLPKPAKILYENNPVAFSTVTWCDDSKHQGRILLGDDSGFCSEVDIKLPNKCVSRQEVFNRPIRKVSCFGSNTAVIGNTNIVRVYDSNNHIIYENADATDFIRDLYWDSDKSFYTIGWDKALRHHVFGPK